MEAARLVAPTLSSAPKWCVLCGGRILAPAGETRAVCPDCGALLDLAPRSAGPPTRHLGEALDAARATLRVASLEQALATLKECLKASEVALTDAQRQARLRRVFGRFVAATILVGLLCLPLGLTMLGSVLVLGGLLTALALVGTPSRYGAGGGGDGGDFGERGQGERQAAQSVQALQDEIMRRTRVLDALRAGRDWE